MLVHYLKKCITISSNLCLSIFQDHQSTIVAFHVLCMKHTWNIICKIILHVYSNKNNFIFLNWLLNVGISLLIIPKIFHHLKYTESEFPIHCIPYPNFLFIFVKLFEILQISADWVLKRIRRQLSCVPLMKFNLYP